MKRSGFIDRLHQRVRETFARLHGDEGGNVIVLSVAASLLLIGMVWAIMGTGQRVVQKETIQSSADAAAFSAAVIKAKGLNIIAFCNLVMAMLFALVMLLRVVKYALIGTAVVLTAICFNPFGGEWACAIAPEVDDAAAQFAQWESKAEQLIKKGMQGLAITERAVAKITPVLALVEAYHVGTDGAYQKNFGKGHLVTIAYPLPTSGLPVQDGTCQDLAHQAVEDFGILTEAIVEKISEAIPIIPKFVAGWIGAAIKKLVSPLAGIMCGGTAQIDTSRISTDCGECRAKGVKSYWDGNQVWRKKDVGCVNGKMPDGTACNPGAFDHDEHKNCLMNSMPSWSCPNEGNAFVSCDNDSDNKSWHFMKFDKCEIDEKQDVKGDSDWPKPLVLVKDWDTKKFTRAFTVLTDTNMDARRRAVSVASKDKGSAPMLNQMLGMAESEFFAWNGSGHDDLWHMDWRARLIRFTFSDGSDQGGSEGDASGSGGPPAGTGNLVSGIISGFLKHSGAASLQDQFLLH